MTKNGKGNPIIETKKALASIQSFSGLDDSALDAIANAATKLSFDPGETIFREGENTSGFYIVLGGWLKAYKISEAGREHIVRIARTGEALNEIGAYIGGANQASAIALERTTVLVVSHEKLFQMMQEHPEIGAIITTNLAKRVRHLMSQVEDLSLRTVIQRLARMFVEHSSTDHLSRRKWATQSEMAAHIGTVPDVLNRAIRSLTDEGLIHVTRRSIRILDRAGLEEVAQIIEKR